MSLPQYVMRVSHCQYAASSAHATVVCIGMICPPLSAYAWVCIYAHIHGSARAKPPDIISYAWLYTVVQILFGDLFGRHSTLLRDTDYSEATPPFLTLHSSSPSAHSGGGGRGMMAIFCGYISTQCTSCHCTSCHCTTCGSCFDPADRFLQ
jgi:hypothetical protein